MNLRTAVGFTLRDVEGYFLADVNLDFSRAYRFDKVEALARQRPGIAGVEGWGYSGGQLLAPDKQTGTSVQFIAPLADSKLIRPILITGRCLTPQDENAIVIGPHLLMVRPDLKVGSTVTIKINDRETDWTIAGIYKMAGGATSRLISHQL